MEREYRLTVEYDNNGVYLATLFKVNVGIETKGVIVADFDSRSAGKAIQKAAEWIKKDIEISGAERKAYLADIGVV